MLDALSLIFDRWADERQLLGHATDLDAALENLLASLSESVGTAVLSELGRFPL